MKYLEAKCSPNTLKDDKMIWNDITSHHYSADILSYDIAISIQEIDNKEEYAYFFLNKKPQSDIFIFELVKVIFDVNMPEKYIRASTKDALTTIVNGNYLRNDRLFVNKRNLAFYKPHINETMSCVCDLMVQEFKTKRDGIVYLFEELEDRLKRINDKCDSD